MRVAEDHEELNITEKHSSPEKAAGQVTTSSTPEARAPSTPHQSLRMTSQGEKWIAKMGTEEKKGRRKSRKKETKTKTSECEELGVRDEALIIGKHCRTSGCWPQR